MTEIQKHLIFLLKEIDTICRENNIQYFIDGGTALGAVRHRGFLPWDDDADIMMTRDNWEKFRKVVTEHPRPNRVIEDMYSNPAYTMVYGRYCDISTTCILRTTMIDQFQSGMFIDIFILDPIPDTPDSKALYFDMLRGFCEYLNPYYYDEIVGVNEWYTYFKEMEDRHGKKAVIDYVERALFSYPDEEGMTYGFRYDRGCWIYPRDVVGTPRVIAFEDEFFPIAERMEDYMRIHYGDNWHIIPAATEEETHNVVIDLNIPYHDFADSYMYLINQNLAKRTYNELHDLRVKQRQLNSRIDMANYQKSGQAYSLVLMKKLAKREGSLKEMLKENKYDEIRSILANYYEMQLNRWYMFYHVYVPIDDETLYCALYLLLVEGQYSKADKILTLRKERGELTENLKTIQIGIEKIRCMVRCFEERDQGAVLDIVNKMRELFPNVIDFIEGEIRARTMMAQETGDASLAETILRSIDCSDGHVHERDWVRACEAMLIIRFGESSNRSDALEVLDDLKQNSRNGMLRLEIHDFIQSMVQVEEKR